MALCDDANLLFPRSLTMIQYSDVAIDENAADCRRPAAIPGATHPAPHMAVVLNTPGVER